MRWFALIGVAMAVGASSCNRQPRASRTVSGSEARSAVPARASASAQAASARPSLDTPGFHLVAELPYPISFAPLGSDALLVAGEGWNQILLSIESNQLRFRPELAQVDDPPQPRPFVSAIAGTWPGNTWLALSSSSDAGPSSSDVYQWRDSRWVKKHEHSSGVIDLTLWRGNIALQGTFFSVPMMVGQQLDELSSSGAKPIDASICSSSGGSLLAPLRVEDDALSVFGFECGQNGAAPESGLALVVETWTKSGQKSRRRLPLPSDAPPPSHVVVDQDGPLVVLSEQGEELRRLARFAGGGWQTVAVLPAEFLALAAPRSFELWGVVGSQLRVWQGRDWAVKQLPADALPSGARWQSVWRRAPDDLWLIAGSAGKSWLFNNADGKSVTPLPNEPERNALGESIYREREPGECPQPFADVLALSPFQLGEDFAVTLSPEKARRLLKAALARNPELRHLQFVRHDCYGEDCLGALVKDADEADKVRRALPAGKFARAGLRCHAPPVTQPFPVSR
jgi:hypothetical protein